MPTRSISIDGKAWRVFPSGSITQYEHDEFGLLFISGTGEGREVRVTRFSPHGSRAREQALAEMPDEDVRRLFGQSQPAETSPEAGYGL